MKTIINVGEPHIGEPQSTQRKGTTKYAKEIAKYTKEYIIVVSFAQNFGSLVVK